MPHDVPADPSRARGDPARAQPRPGGAAAGARRLRRRERAQPRRAPLAPHRGRLSQPAGQPGARRRLRRLDELLPAPLRPIASEVALPAGHVLPAAEALDGVVDRRSDGDRLTWLGHASFLLRLDGRTILTDPYLSDYASPLPPLGPKRFAPPGLPPERLPPIDVLLLSHNHYDHLDLPTIEALAGKERIEVVVPLGLARLLHASAATPRVHELDWHQRAERSAGSRSRRCRRSISPSARCSIATGRCGPATRSRAARKRVYFAGDTAYGPVFQELGRGPRAVRPRRCCRSAPTSRAC